MTKLSGSDCKALRLAIQAAYPSRDDLKLMLREEMNLSLNQIAPEGRSLELTVGALIEWVESRGVLTNFLQCLAVCTQNPKLKTECERLLEVVALSNELSNSSGGGFDLGGGDVGDWVDVLGAGVKQSWNAVTRFLGTNEAVNCFDRGIAYNEKGEYDRAIEDFNKAIQLDNNYAAAYYNRGLAYDNKGEYDRAIEDYNKAIQLDNNFALAYNNRGWVYALKGDYDQAIKDANQSLQLSKSAATYHTRGYAHEKQGKYEQAIADYDRALEINPNHQESLDDRDRLIQKRNNQTTKEKPN